MTDGLAIEVEGLRELRAALRKVNSNMPREVGQAGKKAADHLAPLIRSQVPTRTGRARDSVRAVVAQGGGGIRAGGASAPHYGFVDFGNKVRSGAGVGRGDSQPRRFIKGGRFIYPTFEARRDEVLERYVEAMTGLLRSSGLKED